MLYVQLFLYLCILMMGNNALCRLICSSTETLRKQRSRRRKLLQPLNLLQSLITQQVTNGVLVSSGQLKQLLPQLPRQLVLSGVLLKVCT
jgi:hypothetical protein